MVLSLKQQVKLTQQLLMTPQLQQAIKLLQLNRIELAETLRQEIEQNPVLEEIDTDPGTDLDISAAPTSDTEEQPPPAIETTREVSIDGTNTKSMEEINWDDYDNVYDAGFSFSREAPDTSRASRLDFLSEKPTLKSHLQWQICHAELTPDEKKVADFVIGNLNHHGFLEVTVEDVMEGMECDQQLAERGIEIIQNLDPAGIGARNVRESLLLQLARIGLGDSLAADIIRNHLHSLELKNFGAIARATKSSTAEVLAAVKAITELDPFPGRRFSDEDISYITPDVFIHKVGDEYLIVLNDEGLPRLQLSPHYQQILENADGATSKETKGYLQEKVRDAMWLIKSLQQRQRTIYKVVESILRFQRDFFEHGVSQLRPMILKDVADDIGMHESTVSRVTSNKYVHTPQGVFELKYFFSTAITQRGGDDLAAESIRDRIRTMIKNENPDKPLTDNAISEIFARENIKVARRTVAKYREQLGILPVKLRRKPKL